MHYSLCKLLFDLRFSTFSEDFKKYCRSKIKSLILIGALLICGGTHAQVANLSKVRSSAIETDPLTIANQYIQSQMKGWGLVSRDVSELAINDRYTDQSTGITRIYFLQYFNGIPVHNSILNVNISKDGTVFYSGNRLVRDLDDKINATVPKLSPIEAVYNLAAHLGFSTDKLQLKRSDIESQYVIDQGSIAKEDIIAELCYQPYEGRVQLAWNIRLAPMGSNDVWNTRVDAVTGKILEEDNWTVYCYQGGKAIDGEENSCPVHPDHFEIPDEAIQEMSASVQAQYNVWPFPYDSPDSGPRTIVNDPADPMASPYGWHDIDGQPGAEYTITRGNNAHAYQDRNGSSQSSNDEPDGGPDLQFDFPYDPSSEPDQYLDAAVVHLFYAANFMHDFAYHFGFDEAAGNFQKNNYGNGGKGNDFIKVEAQFGANIDSINNAYYSHSFDGSSAKIGMRIFRGFKNFLTVNEPGIIAGKFRTSPPSAGWGAGAYVTTTPVTGEVVLVEDGMENPYSTDACEPILNASELNGKIALVDRGGCPFGWKALQVQNAGAIGMICRNIDDNNYTMNPGQYGAEVHIPVVMIGVSDGTNLSQYIGDGLKVSLVDPQDDVPEALDSDLDNTMIAHEYAHGISSRIVGGPGSECLDNAEQMDEGWSDFFALATTARPGDTGETKRGFATYVLKDPRTGKGFRTFPYTTDMIVMPLTYGSISAIQEEHDLGQVWCAMIWDMYWALVDQYGWSANPYDSTSGNYKAIKLVIEGLKNTPCSPGFVDGRDAIMAADESLYNGVDRCTLWKVFARRGLGYSADQGSPFDAGDQKEAFDLPPVCTNQILVDKSVTDFIQPGDEIHVTIQVGNYKTDVAGNVKVTDEIPVGTTYKLNSSNFPAQVQGNIISFSIGNMLPRDQQTITYTLLSQQDLWSKRIYLDEVTTQSSSKWLAYTLGDEASNDWMLNYQLGAHTGSIAWNASEALEKSRQALELNPDHYTFYIDSDHPVLRFYHRMQTAGGTSGGVVDVREVGASQWEEVNDDFIRNGYTTRMDYRTFLSPGLFAFSGNSGNEFKASYVDLSRWAGKNIQIRFRFGTIDNNHGGDGWLIDDIEFMDMISYNGEACVTSDQGDIECAMAPEAGTIVESRAETTSIIDQPDDLPVLIYPNPDSDYISVVWSGADPEDINVSLISIDGKVMLTNSFEATRSRILNVDTRDVPAGLYLIKLRNEKQQSVAKVIIQ